MSGENSEDLRRRLREKKDAAKAARLSKSQRAAMELSKEKKAHAEKTGDAPKPTKKTRKVKKAKLSDAEDSDDGHSHSHSHGAPEKSNSHSQCCEPANISSGVPLWVSLILLLVILSSIIWVPFLLKHAASYLQGHFYVLYISWAIETLGLVYILFVRHKGRTTIESAVNNVAIMGIVAFGSYYMLGVPRFIETEVGRQLSLYIWVTVVLLPCMVWAWLDETDYATEEEKERQAAEKASSRAKRRAEKRKKKLVESGSFTQSTFGRLLINSLIYGAILVGGGYWLYQRYQQHEEKVEMDAFMNQEREF